MSKENIKVRVFRENPFCWQSKGILRMLQKKFKGPKLASRITAYTVITQVASDSNADEYETWGVKIMEMAGIGYSTLRKVLNDFEELGIIKRKQERTKKGTYGKLEITLLEPKTTDSQNLPNGKPEHKAGRKEGALKNESKEDSLEAKEEDSLEFGYKTREDKKSVDSSEGVVNRLIPRFRIVNELNWNSFYSNKTERQALKDLVAAFSEKKVKDVIAILPQTNVMPYLPTITTPCELKRSWSKLEAGIAKLKNRNAFKGHKVVIA